MGLDVCPEADAQLPCRLKHQVAVFAHDTHVKDVGWRLDILECFANEGVLQFGQGGCGIQRRRCQWRGHVELLQVQFRCYVDCRTYVKTDVMSTVLETWFVTLGS